MAWSLKVPDIQEVIDKHEMVIDNVALAAEEYVAEAAEYARKEFDRGLRRHTREGKTDGPHAIQTVVKGEVTNDGGVISVEVGSDSKIVGRQAFLHAVWQEYGAPKHFDKDPWFRPVVDNKKAFRKIAVEVCQKHNIPTK